MKTVTVQQAPATVTRDAATHVDQLGDQSFYSAALSVDGVPSGLILGELRTVRVAEDGGSVDRLGLATFRFNETDSLVIAGVVVYAVGSLHSEDGASHRRAVVGGTGQYSGARGEVESVRASDGSFTHTFTLTLTLAS